jgi:pyruvate kinase
MELPTFARDVQPGDQILVNDGKEELRVVSTDGDTQVVLEVVHGKTLEARKGVNLPDSEVSVPSLTDKDRLDLELAILNDVDWVALSFVRKAEDIHQLRHILEFRGSKAKIIAKVEKPQALREIDGIIAASDAVMVARGDLGVEIPIEQVPIWQKRIVAKCNLASKPVIVATQMLDSMIENPRPTRAEATDVLNAVLDGADAVMLSGETSVGKHPLVVVETMQRIIEEAEREDSLYHRDLSFDRESPTFHSDVTCRAAVKLAEQIGATAIVGMTYSGYTAYRLSRYRPHAHIFIFTENRRLLSAMSLVWGVRAFYYDSYVGTNETIRDVNQILVEQGLIQPGDIVINTGVMPIRSRSRTNMVKFTVIE